MPVLTRFLAAGLLTSALLPGATSPALARPPQRNWHVVAVLRDQTRIKNWRHTWIEALAEARAAGFGPQIEATGALLQPDAAIEQPAIPDGVYTCRTVKLGREVIVAPDPSPLFQSLPPARCRVTGMAFAQLEGAQRPSGTFYADNGMRLIFLGAMALGDEPAERLYGRDPQRSLAGTVERIGPARWRIAIPQPPWEAKLEVIELVPARG